MESPKSVKQIKSVKLKNKANLYKAGKVKSPKNIEKTKEIEEGDEPEDDIELESIEETEFTERILTEYKSPFEYHIFDPKEYKYDSHKEITIVKPENRITSEIMSKYEYTEVISHRARQIENGGTMFCELTEATDDPIRMAELEVEQKRCPLSILRMYNLNWGEIWCVNEMGVPDL
jgi:DNA-directed RNA polymerase subunit K/omega